MQVSKSRSYRFLLNIPAYFFIGLIGMAVISSCKKDVEITRNIDYNVIYEVDTVYVYQTSADKTKQKSSDQYISILYSDLYQKSILANDLSELSQATLAIGDKQLVNEIIISNYLNSTDAIVPTDTDMRADVDQFIEATYKRFYLRKPTELEKEYLTNLIESDQTITPDIVYAAFSLSDEYLYY